MRDVENHEFETVRFVGGGGNWCFRWCVHYLVQGLRNRIDIPIINGGDPWQAGDEVIHFIDRYEFLDGPYRRLHPSNRAFVSWFHGSPRDRDRALRRVCKKVPRAAEHLQTIIVSCRISKDVLLKLGVPESKIEMIPLGVDCERFIPASPQLRTLSRARLGIPQDAVCIGSFQKDGYGWRRGRKPKLVKGPDVFLGAVERLAARHDKLFVLLTGPAREYVKRGLKKRNIPFVHHYEEDYHELPRYYHALDLYMITSRSEGGPMSFLESWASGVPVVSTEVGMPADWIRLGENGMLVPIEDVQGLADSVSEVIEDQSLRDTVRRHALNDVKQFDWKRVAALYHEKLLAPLLD